jgi:hypothetical protein
MVCCDGWHANVFKCFAIEKDEVIFPSESCLVDSDGFTFKVSATWENGFVEDFIKGYEERNINPIPNLVAYFKYRGSQPCDIGRILIYLPESYKAKFQRLMLLC